MFFKGGTKPRMLRVAYLVCDVVDRKLGFAKQFFCDSHSFVDHRLMDRDPHAFFEYAVEIKRVSNKTLVGASPEIIRHFVELRGIGVIDVKEIFGMGAIKDTESIDLIIHLEPWVDGKQYDRLGMVDEYTNIMGINIPSMTVPVKIGRNIAVIIEVAAMNNRQKKMGYNAAIELNNRLMKQMMENSGM